MSDWHRINGLKKQKILQSYKHDQKLKILIVCKNPKSCMEIIKETNIPITSAFRLTKQLVDDGLLEIAGNRDNDILYQSKYRDVKIDIKVKYQISK